MREEFHALGFQTVFAQCAHQIGQTLRTMTQGKAPTVFDDAAGAGTKLVKRAGLLTSCRAAAASADYGE